MTKKAMLTAFAIVAIIATTEAVSFAQIDEYSREVEERLSLCLDIDDGEKEAQLINANIPTQFHLLVKPKYGDVILNADSGSDQSYARCPWLGIKSNDGMINFSAVTTFSLECDAGHFTDTIKRLYFIVACECDRKFGLKIPILRIPGSKTSFSSEKLSRWAKRKRLGLRGPLEEDQIRELREWNALKQPLELSLALNFTWLGELLEYGVTKQWMGAIVINEERMTTAYRTRPILFPDAFVEKLIDVVDWFKFRERIYVYEQLTSQ